MNEETLRLALKQGDKDVFVHLLDLYGDRLFRSAFLLCGQKNVAEDLVQETFLQGLRSAKKFRGQSAIYTWLHGILLNLNRKRNRNIFRLVFPERLPEIHDTSLKEKILPDDSKKISELINSSIQLLSLKHREVLIMFYFENLSVEEISRQIRVGEGTIKSRLHYARAKLEKFLPPELNLFSF
ncbi:RNA polymerase sigma factor [Opitutales bacterium]|jgi:RNA polymerase sigma-70 factor (ECF subfamily)|nr:RNA polymerase sigma factor [Opitutales bacterium]